MFYIVSKRFCSIQYNDDSLYISFIYPPTCIVPFHTFCLNLMPIPRYRIFQKKPIVAKGSESLKKKKIEISSTNSTLGLELSA